MSFFVNKTLDFVRQLARDWLRGIKEGGSGRPVTPCLKDKCGCNQGNSDECADFQCIKGRILHGMAPVGVHPGNLESMPMYRNKPFEI